MTPIELETTLLVVAVAAACAVPGVLLVLRRLALVGDAISHVLLFGIVVAWVTLRAAWHCSAAVAIIELGVNEQGAEGARR